MTKLSVKASKDEMHSVIQEESPYLDDMLHNLTKLLSDLKLTCQHDVSLSAVDQAKEVLKRFPECRTSLENITRVMKARARTRVSEM